MLDYSNNEYPRAFDGPVAAVSKRGRFRPTIQEWARTYARPANNPRGDFIEDLRRDGRFGDSNPQSLDELKTYLWTCSASFEAVAVAGRVFRQYRAWCRRHGMALESVR